MALGKSDPFSGPQFPLCQRDGLNDVNFPILYETNLCHLLYTNKCRALGQPSSHVVLVLQRGKLKLTEIKEAAQVTQALDGELAFGPRRSAWYTQAV